MRHNKIKWHYKTCVCGKHPAKYQCDGCGEDFGNYCGNCARPVYVVFMGNIMLQRLCPACRMSGQHACEEDIYDARLYAVVDDKIVLRRYL